jgi:hypothetical protein
MLVNYLPASWLPRLKGIVAALGGIASAVLAVYPGVANLHWFVIASAAVTAVLTYLVPNIKTPTVTVTPDGKVHGSLDVLGSGGETPAVTPVLPSELPTPPQPVKPAPVAPEPVAEAATVTPPDDDDPPLPPPPVKVGV